MSMINSIQIKGVTHELPSGASAVVEGTDLKTQNGNTVSSAINPAGFTYSKNEMVVGKWIDGKPIYRRVGEKSDDADVIQQIALAEDGQGYIYTKGLIPTLTSNISAADTVGTAIRSDYSNGCEAWNAMNNDKLTRDNCWYKNSRPCWLGFHFNNPVIVKSFFLRQEHESPEYIRGFIFQASNNGEDWIDLGEYRMSQQTLGFEEGYFVDNNTEYTYYRWYFNDGPGGGISVQLAQMYDINIFDKIYEYTKKSDAPNSFTPAMLDITSVAVPKEIDAYSNIDAYAMYMEGDVKLTCGKRYLHSKWNGGGSIGSMFISYEKIDMTPYKSITTKLISTKHYSDNFFNHLALTNESRLFDPKSSSFREVRSNVLNEEVVLTMDVSDLNESYYVALCPIGHDTTFYSLEFN